MSGLLFFRAAGDLITEESYKKDEMASFVLPAMSQPDSFILRFGKMLPLRLEPIGDALVVLGSAEANSDKQQAVVPADPSLPLHHLTLDYSFQLPTS